MIVDKIGSNMQVDTMSPPTETTQQSTTKRKAFIAGFPEGVRPAKRRAAKACQTCRSRKVRCDVVDSGPPCNNCRLDRLQCIVSDSRRKRKPRSCSLDEQSQSPVSSNAESDAGDVNSNMNIKSIDWFPSSDYADRVFCTPSAGNSFELELDRHVPHMLYRMQGRRLNHEERIRRISLGTAQATHHICDLLNANPNQQINKRTSAEKYQQCIEVLQQLHDIYASAASATSFLQKAMRSPNLATNLSLQSANPKIKRTKHTSATVLTPPPDTDEPATVSHSSMPSKYLRSMGQYSPPASDGSDECASFSGMMPPDHTSNTIIGDVDLDHDFDTLFNLDADMDFGAAEEDESKSSSFGPDPNDPHHGAEWTPFTPWTTSGNQVISKEILHRDRVAEMSISAYA